MVELGTQKPLMQLEKYQEKLKPLQVGAPFHLLDHFTLMSLISMETIISTY